MSNSIPILIAGRACQLPGASNYEKLRELLQSKSCSIGTVGEDRWAQWRFFHPVPGTPSKAYTQSAGLLSDIWGFDPKPFGLSPREATQMDPQQRLLLQTVWEALESANLKPSELAGENVGVFVGASSMDFGTRLMYDPALSDIYTMTGSTLSVIANRISYIFDLKGPSFTVDTACSSSLVALNEAVSALRSGRVDVAIVGGVNIILNPMPFLGFSAGRFLSPTGRCHSFSDNADGYVRSEGVVSLVLRRGDASIGSASPVYGEILGTDINSDGRTSGIALPNGESQAELLTTLYQKAEIKPEQLSFIEAHGTGTQVGDAAEARAVGSALGKHRTNPLPIGSIKSNIGHLEPVSGLAGIMKALIAFEARQLPATLHAETPNRYIDFNENNLVLATEPLSLGNPSEKLVAGVSSFGFGGTNAHVILSSPENSPVSDANSAAQSKPQAVEQILFASAFCTDALSETALGYADSLSDQAVSVEGFSKAVLENRDMHPERLAVLGANREDVLEGLHRFAEREAAPHILTASSHLNNEPTIFVYSGNGAQYAGMCRAAYNADANYARHFDKISNHFSELAGWSLVEMLDDPALEEKLAEAKVAQPLLFADQVALSFALSDKGLAPAGVLGHSGGEIAAAHVCGSLDLDQALKTIVERSNSQEKLVGKGAMAALQAPAEEAQAELDSFGAENLTIAAVNSPRGITLVGPPDDLKAFLRHVRKTKRWASVKLPVNYPYHSPLQDEIEAIFRSGLKYITPAKNKVPFFSSIYGKEVAGESLDKDYWWSLLREPVQFMQAVQSAHESGFRMFLECGPQPVLTSYLNDILSTSGEGGQCTHTLEKSDNAETNPVSKAVCRAFVNGAAIDDDIWWPSAAQTKAVLPTYAWQNVEYRIDVTEMINNALGISEDAHAALGRKYDDDAHLWVSQIDANLRPDLAQHVVNKRSLVPGSFFLETTLAAARFATGSSNVEIRDLDIHAPLVLMEKSSTDLRTQLSVDASSITVSSRPVGNEDNWLTHVTARFGALSELAMDAPSAPDVRLRNGDHGGSGIYRIAEQMGLQYRTLFRNVSHLRNTGPRELEVILGDAGQPALSNAVFDPVSMDSIFHGLLAGLQQFGSIPKGIAYVPVHVRRVRAVGSETTFKSGRIRVTRVGSRSAVADFDCFDSEGDLVAKLEGVRFSAMRISDHFDPSTAAYSFEAVPVLEPEVPETMQSSISPTSLCDSIQKSAEKVVDGAEVSHLLIEAICQRIAYDALSGAANADGLLSIDDLQPCNQAFLELLLDMLALSELARPGEEGTWQLEPEIDLPDASAQIANLLVERPDAVVECALLARMAKVLPDLIKRNISQTELFGAELLKAYVASSISAHERLGLAKTWLGEWAATFDEKTRQPVAIVLPFKDLLSPGSVRRHNGVELTIVSFDQLPELDMRFSLMLFPMGLPPKLVGGKSLETLSGLLRKNGAIACVESLSDSLTGLLSAIGVPDETISEQQIIAHRFYEDEDTWKTALSSAAFDAPHAAELEHGLSGFSVFAATVPLSADSKQTENAITARTNGAAITFLEYAEFRQKFDLVHHDEASDFWLFHAMQTDFEKPDDQISLLYLPATVTDQSKLEMRITALREMLQEKAASQQTLWIVLPNGAPAGNTESIDPMQVAVWSFLRTAANEYPGLDIHLADIAEYHPAAFDRLLACVTEETAETELLFRSDETLVMRVVPGLDAKGSKSRSGINPAEHRTVLTMPSSGRLDELRWELAAAQSPGANEVEIEVAATGLNYRDVMWALGLLPEEALENGFAGATLGIEYSGRVRRVGSDVQRLAVGDLVAATGPASFASRIVLDEKKAFRLPAGIDMSAAASIPVAFFTAYYAISHLANLQEDETILVHGAAGGVGLAAIQVAKAAGATVIGTAGTAAKRDLLRALGADHVFDSRSLKFAEEVRMLTAGEGVDAVLNSLAGEAMELSLDVLRPFGRFIELGKQDYYLNSKVGLRALKENITYFGVDADQVMAARPELVTRLFSEIMEKFHQGAFSPLPYRSFEGDQVVEAFRLMQRSAHIGKIVVKPKPYSPELPLAEKPVFAASSEGVHVIAGGLGGVGLELASWLVERGARTIALLSRTGNLSDHANEKIETLQSAGADIRVISCDVSNSETVSATLENLRSEMPITGIINAAMVLEDTEIRNLDADNLRRTFDAKINGSKNLDRATSDDVLDYFVMFSSVASMIGNIGQSAYVAANGFMEGLARQRRQKGLPGLAVGWGAVSDAGYLAREPEKAALVNRFSGNIEFSVSNLLDTLEELLVRERQQTLKPVVTVTPMSWSAAANVLKTLKTPTFKLLAKKAAETAGTGDLNNFRESLQNLPKDKLVTRLSDFILKEIATVLRVSESDLSLTRPISEFGMDSLMGVEFAIAAQKALGEDIPMTMISVDGITINDIAEKIAVHILSNSSEDKTSDTMIQNLAAQHADDDVHKTDLDRDELLESLSRREQNLDRIID